jgi:hypothetical protein
VERDAPGIKRYKGEDAKATSSNVGRFNAQYVGFLMHNKSRASRQTSLSVEALKLCCPLFLLRGCLCCTLPASLHFAI